tara:strand:- start:1133 stop:1321 length:189 start_codon:yes stop_codon:yes gene_type:complete
MGLVSAMKLGLAINSKLKEATNRETIIKAFTESVEGRGQFSVVEWSVLGKQLEIFGNGNGKE